MYMEQKQFDLALQFCGNNNGQKSQVLLQQAHHLLSKHQYVPEKKSFFQVLCRT